MSHHDYRRDVRQQALELIIRWEGGCNATTLGEMFALDRTHAGRDFRDYQARFGGIAYDASQRLYCATADFQCQLSRGSLTEYVELCARHRRNDGIFDIASVSPIPVREDVFQAMLRAIRARDPVDITYQSWNHPTGVERRIHPHALAYSGLRWHARAFDKRTQSYRDFNLNRVIALDAVTGVEYVSGDDDRQWHERVRLELAPNPILSEQEKQMIAAEYGMSDERLIIHPRQSLCHYVMQALNAVLADDPAARYPRSHPIVVSNPDTVRGLLFGYLRDRE